MPDTLLDSAEAAHNPAALANQLVHERAADIVELLNEQTPEVAAIVILITSFQQHKQTDPQRSLDGLPVGAHRPAICGASRRAPQPRPQDP